jgi:hypothetical protein
MFGVHPHAADGIEGPAIPVRGAGAGVAGVVWRALLSHLEPAVHHVHGTGEAVAAGLRRRNVSTAVVSKAGRCWRMPNSGNTTSSEQGEVSSRRKWMRRAGRKRRGSLRGCSHP